jgi:hypothetical protein
MDSFTYVISSINSTTANTANNCFIKLAGLPNNQKFLCEVIDFALNVNTIDATMIETYLVLAANTEMQILNGVQHPNKFNRICNIDRSTGLMTGYGHVFQVGNFNNHTVNFQIGLPNLTLLPTGNINVVTSSHWTLSLKMTPIQ